MTTDTGGIVSTLIDALTPGTVILLLMVFVFMGTVLEFFILTPKYPDLPTVGHGKGPVAFVKNVLDYTGNWAKWLEEGYREHNLKDKSFVTPRVLAKSPLIVIPPSQARWMLNQPDHVLSTLEAHDQVLHLAINFLEPDFRHDNFHSQVVVKNLARALPRLIPALQAEVEWAVDEAFGTQPGGEWREVNLWGALLKIIPVVTGRILVGEGINRHSEYLESMVNFTMCVVRNIFLLAFMPRLVRPVLGWLLTWDSWLNWRRAARLIMPRIRARRAALERGDDDMPDDYVTWALRQAREQGAWKEYNDAERLSKRLLPLTFAAIHTTVLTAQSSLIDIFSSSSSPEKHGDIVDALRGEAVREYAACGGKWDKPALARLVKLDSAIRESQRVSPFGVTLVERLVVSKEGLTNEREGWHAPKGTMLVMNWRAVQRDGTRGGAGYDGLRFARVREEGADAAEKDQENGEKSAVGVVDTKLMNARLGMVTMNEEHFPFGHGRHTCPGRFFVAHELKMAFVHLLRHYDIEPIPERPETKFLGQTVVPPLAAALRLRRREVPHGVCDYGCGKKIGI